LTTATLLSTPPDGRLNSHWWFFAWAILASNPAAHPCAARSANGSALPSAAGGGDTGRRVMMERLMLLPSKDVSRARLVTVPEDLSAHEAFHYVAGLVNEVPREDEEHWVETVLAALEDHGFETAEFVLGPSLD
jgi:hypothetical protein